MKKITQTSTLHGYKRTYFINQGEINGEAFIEITESKRVEKGRFIRYGPIKIFLQDLEAVVEALNKINEDSK